MDVELKKKKPKQKVEERKIYYLQQVSRTPATLIKAKSPGAAKLGKFYIKGVCVLIDTWEVGRVQPLGD